jgi:predicted aldo/keto reductase-like oxidoreductase
MGKRAHTQRDPEDAGRRQVVKGGLLAAATALGFLPACADDERSPAASEPPDQGMGAGGAGGAAGTASRAAPSSSAAQPSGGSGGAASPGSSGASAPSEPASTAGADSVPGVPPASRTLPRAMLGNTGVSIPILGLGTSRLGQRGGTPNAADFENMLRVFEAAIDMGIEYVDTGATYGRAEEALGELIPSRRDRVFLVTKLFADTRAEAQSMFERSLTRMKVDHVDLLHLHSVGQRNLDTALSPDGAWSYIQEQKAAGLARFVGITGHNDASNFTRMLATDQVDVLMTIMNFVDHSTYGFSKTVREDALARGVGVMTMKVFGGTESVLRPGGGLANSSAPEPHPSNMELAFDVNVLPDCMRFVKGLGGVSGMVIGVNHLEELERNIGWAIETQPFDATEMDAIVRMGEALAPSWAQRYG